MTSARSAGWLSLMSMWIMVATESNPLARASGISRDSMMNFFSGSMTIPVSSLIRPESFPKAAIKRPSPA